MNPQLKATVEELANKARGMLRQHGHLMPVAFIFYNQNSVDICGCPWTDDDGKEETVVFLRNMARQKNATAFAMLAEAWHAKLDGCKSLADWDGTPASEMPNREEIVQVYVESLDGYWFGMAPITRDTGRPTFGALEWQPMRERHYLERFQKILA